MKITTKFDVGDKVVFLDKSKIKSGIVDHIEISVKKEYEEKYWFRITDKKDDWHYETRMGNEVFKTKEDFISQL